LQQRKAGLKMLTHSFASEWTKCTIQLNGIGTGYFDTSQTEPIRVDVHSFNDFIINITASVKYGKPEDLAGATIFLALEASILINGRIVYVDVGILVAI
tara:strand:- start:461 stop:757 length:297 start_codon:yes stop_codon:yes gene_type:complete